MAGKTRHQPRDNATDEQVLDLLDCNSSAAEVRQRMLVAASAAMSRGPAALRALMASHANATRYAQRLSHNLRWLWRAAPCFSEWPDPAEQPAPWHDIMLNNPAEWSKAVRSAVDRSVDCKTARPKYVDLGDPPP